jgi:hypothetical protein
LGKAIPREYANVPKTINLIVQGIQCRWNIPNQAQNSPKLFTLVRITGNLLAQKMVGIATNMANILFD